MGGRTLKNAAWIVGCKIVQAILGVFVTALSARYLGPSNYGLINYAASITSFIAPLMLLGLDGTLVQEIVSHPEKEGETVGTAIVFNVISAVLCMIGTISFAYIANPNEPITWLVCGLYSMILLSQALETIRYWYQAKLISQYTSLIGLAAYVLVSAYKIYLLVTQKSIYWFAVSQAIDYAIIAITLIFFYYRLSPQKLTVSFKRFREMFAKSKYFIVSSMMVTIFAQTDKIMLKAMLGDESVGIYSAAVTCAGLTSFVFAAIIDSFRPTIFESKKVSKEQYEKNIITCYSVVIFLSLAQSVVFTLFSGLVIDILYGSAYAASAGVLSLIVWYTTFSYVGPVRNIWILAENKQRYLWIINLSGALANVVLNFCLIPVMGAMGAALASLITQIFTNVIVGFIMKPIRYNNLLMLKGCDPRPLIGYAGKLIAKLIKR